MSDHALYRFYAADGTLLYIGITCNVTTRWRAHAKDKPWWHEVATCTLERYPDRPSVLAAERAAILAERPRWNVIYNGAPVLELDEDVPDESAAVPFWVVMASWVFLTVMMGLMIGGWTAVVAAPLAAAVHTILVMVLAGFQSVVGTPARVQRCAETVARRWDKLTKEAAA